MGFSARRLAAIARASLIAAVALSVASPAAAQFGGLKKKLKSVAAQEAVDEAVGGDEAGEETGAVAGPAAPAAGDDDGGTVVLTEDVIARLIAGLKAGQAERDAADKEDTPYGRYKQAQAAYQVAEPKCQQAQQGFIDRMVGNEKMGQKYTHLVEKMVQAQSAGDMKLVRVYEDSSKAMIDPSCTVRRPEEPNDIYQTHRAVNERAEQATIKQSGLSRSEYSQVRERVETVLRKGTPAGDISASEKAAVEAKAGELKQLLNLSDA